jgi:hypothetical protein
VPPSGRFAIVPHRGLRVRIAAGLAVTALACEIINADGRWAAKEPSRRHFPDAWPRPDGAVPVVSHPADLLEDTLRARGTGTVHEAAG